MFKVKVTQNNHISADILRLKLVTVNQLTDLRSTVHNALSRSPSMLRFKKGGVRHCRAAVMEERLMHRDATLERQEWIE